MPMHFNQRDSEVYDLYNLITRFCVRYEIFGSTHAHQLKQLLSEAMIGERPLEAAIGQFLAQLDHINAE